MRRGGFDAVVSNPPFMGGKKISGALGKDYREYLKQRHRPGTSAGSADLCSYFLLRDLSIARRGRVGIIATNTIAQGDTREVGLRSGGRHGVGCLPSREVAALAWNGSLEVSLALDWASGRAGSVASSTGIESQA